MTAAQLELREQWQGKALRVAAAGILACLAKSISPMTSYAHSGPPPTPENIWTAWSFHALVVTPLLLAVFAYIRGVRAVWRRSGRGRGFQRWQIVLGGTAFMALALALVSPLDALSTALFSAHMVQHMLLIVIAPPLLVLANAGVAYLWSIPRSWRSQVTGVLRRDGVPGKLWHYFARPAPVLALHSLVLWGWHAPVAYDAAVTSSSIHLLEHMTMFGTALLFWWLVIQRGRQTGAVYGIGVAMIFAVVIQKTALGALITFSPRTLYTSYSNTTAAWGLTPLEDQQLAGAVMMGPWGLVYLIAGVALFAGWIRAIERSVERKDRLAGTFAPVGKSGNKNFKESL